MAQPEVSHRVKVGVLLARQPGDLGEWVADGSAFDAAGADALWLDALPEVELDPLALAAALAAVTFRSLLVTTLRGSDGASPAGARMLTTVDRLSRGRLRIRADETRGGLAEGRSGVLTFRKITGHPETFEPTPDSEEAEHWMPAAFPDSRATWHATLLDAAERGLDGLVLPTDPRLLDILRNPDDLGDRQDLQLAQG